MIHQSKSGRTVQEFIDEQAQYYARQISSEELTLEDARTVLKTGELTMAQVAGLAKAIACFE